ncbi:hypothetical protein ACFCX0_45960 [Streptomyces sp. NPDC056352]|uniref:hypothetical protein n=1 Tax=Streptomyces sp. NPDC056352 TaxID=3345791 RepID=UPI0035DC9D50
MSGTGSQAAIEVRGLVKTFREKRTVDGIDLTVLKSLPGFSCSAGRSWVEALIRLVSQPAPPRLTRREKEAAHHRQARHEA